MPTYNWNPKNYGEKISENNFMILVVESFECYYNLVYIVFSEYYLIRFAWYLMSLNCYLDIYYQFVKMLIWINSKI